MKVLAFYISKIPGGIKEAGSNRWKQMYSLEMSQHSILVADWSINPKAKDGGDLVMEHLTTLITGGWHLG